MKILKNMMINFIKESDHLYRINVKNRKELIQKFEDNNISYGIHYNCQHKTHCFKKNISLEKSEKESEETISIPFHEELKLKDQKLIINLVQDYVKV
jgi:dTDP-4-amino-4,6-dideoxygalactose transaminase